MRRKHSLFAATAAAAAGVATAALAIAGPATAAPNAVANSGFETGSLSGWNCGGLDSAVAGHASRTRSFEPCTR